MQKTKWWKCDLQVATPAWFFRLPESSNYDFAREEDRLEFADRYMAALRAKGIEVIVLADHNSHGWIDEMKAAGTRNNIIVFPGCEVTTGSGADGIHIGIIGDLAKNGQDFDRLLAGPLGFGDDHPRFFEQSDGNKHPGSSSKTLTQILEDLPQEYLAIAPHVLGENGLASASTAKGQIRWKALHHYRLNAIDPGDCSNTDGDSFNSRFRRRELDDFPVIKRIAFVSTSDAYRLEDLGRRYCWIRMSIPSLESLRQAFLDYEARIICDWDSRLTAYADQNPNNIRHAWIESVHLEGNLGNSNASLTIDFHPALNVIIGGRGSGKSTVVAALRQLYSGFASLPHKVKEEAELFADRIFSVATLRAKHYLPNSQEEQTASWDKIQTQLTTLTDLSVVATTFPVRVINQKELFERVSQDKDDPFAASRSFLAFVDEGLGLQKTEPVVAGSWWREYEEACADWMEAIRNYQKLKADLRQLPVIRSKIKELEKQIAAFDSPAAKTRREANDARMEESQVLAERELEVEKWLLSLRDELSKCPVEDISNEELLRQDLTQYELLKRSLTQIATDVKRDLTGRVDAAISGVKMWRTDRDASAWGTSVVSAKADSELYVEELKTQGIDPTTYEQLKSTLSSQLTLSKQLAVIESSEPVVRERVEKCWQDVLKVVEQRRLRRKELLKQVGERSGRLSFEVNANRDKLAWIRAVRELLNLRADAFLDDIPRLAAWLWDENDEAVRLSRWAVWRNALASGDFGHLTGMTEIRPPWLKKLQQLDETVRLRLAVEVADDTVTMKFLRDGGSASNVGDWQIITEGSPGQRTAAMLGFVLHHGTEPLILDQPEDDLDTEWISSLVVKELRASRWKRQIIVVSHNANIPVNGDAEQVIVLENKDQSLQIRKSIHPSEPDSVAIPHVGPIETDSVRQDIQNIMEGGIRAFITRERKYNNEVVYSQLLD